MNDEQDPTVTTLSRAAEPPLPAALRQRTLALARTRLASSPGRHRVRAFADFAPPLSLVPSLLISAGAAFVVDAFIKVVRLFCVL